MRTTLTVAGKMKCSEKSVYVSYSGEMKYTWSCFAPTYNKISKRVLDFFIFFPYLSSWMDIFFVFHGQVFTGKFYIDVFSLNSRLILVNFSTLIPNIARWFATSYFYISTDPLILYSSNMDISCQWKNKERDDLGGWYTSINPSCGFS